MSPEKVIEKIIKSGLRGRGGTGLNTGQKWLLAHRKSLRQKYFLCTAIEGEPGINKDRVIIENDPQYSGRYGHLRYAIGAYKGFIYFGAHTPAWKT